MAGRITGLSFQKRTPDRVNVYIDDKFAFGLPALEAARLKVGQHLTDEDIARLRQADSVQKAYDRAVRFLGYRPRSRKEVAQNLAEAGLDPALIETVISRLAQQGYLNDAEFARFWVENRERFRPRGQQALRQELRLKGVDDETVNAALGTLDQTESAYRAAQGRAQRMAALAASDPRGFRQKLSGFLQRRGFTYDVIREVVTRLEHELADESVLPGQMGGEENVADDAGDMPDEE
jgi:regulatory protein